MNDWTIWEKSLHNEEAQIKKQEKAVLADCKPMAIDIPLQSGEFISPQTGEIYQTTLTSCTCTSFKRDEKPCKHMYRLAFELQEMSAPHPLSYAYAKPEALSLFDSVSQEAANLFVYSFSGEPGNYFPQKDSPELQELIKIGFVEICTDKNTVMDIQLNSLKKDALLSLCSSILGCPAKSSKKQTFVDFIKTHTELLENIGELPLCVCASHNIDGLYNTIKVAYHKKYPSPHNDDYLWFSYSK